MAYLVIYIRCFRRLKERFATRLAVIYNYLWPVFGPSSIGNANKNSFITLYSNSVRRYGGVLVSESLCLLVKITQSDEVFFALLMNLVATVALARNFVGLLHSTIAERSNETIKPATVFQNSTEKITKATKLCGFCCIPLHN